MNVVDRGILWHHFGRGTGGYVTLARSSRLPEGIAKKLERFAWGQPRRAGLTDAVSPDPGLWIEPIGPFVAITRISAGPPDRSDRATLSFFTLLPTREQYVDEVLPHLDAILREPGNWADPGRATMDLVGLGQMPAVSPAANSDLVRRLLAVTAANPSTSIVLPAASLRIEQVCHFLRALPANQVADFRVAYRALSDAIVADLVVPDLDYSPEKAAGRRVMLSGGDLEGSRQIVDTMRERVSVPLNGSSSSDAATRGAQRWHPPQTNELDMTKTTVAVLAVVAGLVLVFGVANLWLVARNAEEVAASIRRHYETLQADIKHNSDGITKAHAAALANSVTALDHRLDALGKHIETIGDRHVERLQVPLKGIKEDLDNIRSTQVASAGQQGTDFSQLKAVVMEVVKELNAKVDRLYFVTFWKTWNTALAPKRPPVGVANKAAITKENGR